MAETLYDMLLAEKVVAAPSTSTATAAAVDIKAIEDRGAADTAMLAKKQQQHPDVPVSVVPKKSSPSKPMEKKDADDKGSPSIKSGDEGAVSEDPKQQQQVKKRKKATPSADEKKAVSAKKKQQKDEPEKKQKKSKKVSKKSADSGDDEDDADDAKKDSKKKSSHKKRKAADSEDGTPPKKKQHKKDASDDDDDDKKSSKKKPPGYSLMCAERSRIKTALEHIRHKNDRRMEQTTSKKVSLTAGSLLEDFWAEVFSNFERRFSRYIDLLE